MPGWGTGFHWWAWVLGIATTAVFWALVIWAIVALVRWARHDGNGPAAPGGSRDTRDWRDPQGASDGGNHGGGPQRTLARQYASGEIDVGEYHRRVEASGR